MVVWLEGVAAYCVPVLLILILLLSLIRKADIYDCFLEGVREGMKTVYNIFPAILAIYVAIAMLKTSGLLEAIGKAILPATKLISMPQDILPLALLRPVSGSGAIGLVDSLLRTHGSDSLVGMTAAVMCASTETTFYTLAMYFGAAKIKKTSYALPSSLVADMVSIVASVLICHYFFYR